MYTLLSRYRMELLGTGPQQNAGGYPWGMPPVLFRLPLGMKPVGFFCTEPDPPQIPWRLDSRGKTDLVILAVVAFAVALALAVQAIAVVGAVESAGGDDVAVVKQDDLSCCLFVIHKKFLPIESGVFFADDSISDLAGTVNQ